MALTKVDISLMDNVGTTANKLLAYDGSGNLPAVDGSQLTNPNTGITNSASDPTISTNPSGGVGTEWHNTTSGEVYICTNATAGANVWTNVGAGSGNVQPISHAQGGSYGYCLAGTGNNNQITKYSFTVDGNDVDVADLTVARYTPAGASSTTHGYCAAGYGGGNNVIDRFSFAAGSNAVDVGDTFAGSYIVGGTYSATYGYIHCGTAGNVLQKYQMAASANGTDVGNMRGTPYTINGASSENYGYLLGGNPSPSGGTEIEKYSYTTDGNSTDVGDLGGGAFTHAGANDKNYAYAVAGASTYNAIEKFAFANESPVTDFGDLDRYVGGFSVTSSYTHGYAAGGYGTLTGSGGASYLNSISKFSFSAGGNATDVGDLASRSGNTVAEHAPASY